MRWGDLARAQELGSRALELVDGTDALNQRANVRLDVAEVLLAAGRHEDARTRALEAEEIFARKGNIVGAGRARAMLERLPERSDDGEPRNTGLSVRGDSPSR